MISNFYQFFKENPQPLFSASASGRLDVMGGIADYSGSMVLQKVLSQETKITIRTRSDLVFSLVSVHDDGSKKSLKISLDDLLLNNEVNFGYIRERLKAHSWALYVLGCFLILKKEKGLKLTGADVLIESNVPMGKGVASSAALEVATLKTLQKTFDIQFIGTELSKIAQRVENEIVGAPCGLMDQLASFFGDKNSLLPIVCQPDLIEPLIKIPENIYFIGIDSGKKHSVAANPYRDVRTAAFMGYSMIEQWMGASKAALKRPSSLHYKGYLANVSKHSFDVEFLYKLPKTISGREFIEKYGESIDPLTAVHPDKVYAVRQATLHPVYENERVKRFAEIIKKTVVSNQDIIELGELMGASHASYSACELGSKATDSLVEMANKYKQKGILGAKITGGGTGGTVCLLCEGQEGLEAAHQIHKEYQDTIQDAVVLFQ